MDLNTPTGVITISTKIQSFIIFPCFPIHVSKSLPHPTTPIQRPACFSSL